MKKDGWIARMWEKRNVYIILVGISAWKRPFGRTKRRWKDNIKTKKLIWMMKHSNENQ
jgi:hypothetical protein